MITQDLNALRHWAIALEEKLRATAGITDVTSDQDRAGPQVNVVIDRDAAARLGVNTTAIDNALNNAYSQRQISTIYTQRNQYKVVLEIDPRLQTDPSLLDRIYVGGNGGQAGAAVGGCAVRARHGAAGGASSGPVPRGDAQLQPRTRHGARRCRNCGGQRRARIAHAGGRAHRVRRQRAIPAAVACHPAAADRRRVDLDLHRARACCTKACCIR